MSSTWGNKIKISLFGESHGEGIGIVINNLPPGIELNLDPNCVKTFEYANDKAWEIKQMAKAEIENHIAKGKW